MPNFFVLLFFYHVAFLPIDLFDVDPSYELTTDNVMKMMAIWMRFKCNIPVVIMGETGCGKTRLIRLVDKSLPVQNLGKL